MLKKLANINVAVLILFFVLSVFITYPLIFHLSNYIIGYGDDLFIAWVMNWNIHSIKSFDLLNLFQANIFYPYSNSLAFSETFLTSSIFTLPIVLFFKSPIVANNFTFILSLTLMGFFSFLLSDYIIKNKLLSILAGVLIIFCPTYLGQADHLQVISIYFVPLSIYFLLRYLKEQKEILFIGFLVALILQTYNSFFPGYFIFFAAVSILLFFYFKNKHRIRLFVKKRNLVYLILSLLLIVLISIPYFKVSKEFNYVRDIRETIHFANQPEDFLVASDQSRLQTVLSALSFTKDLEGKGEVKPAFLGFIFSILSILSTFYFIKNFKRQNYIVKGLLFASLLGLLLSLGPFLHLARLTIHKPFPIPLPYTLFYYLIPGFQGIRNSSRFEFLFIIFMAPLIALFLKEKLKNLTERNLISITFIVLVIVEFNPFKYLTVPLPKDFPKVYAYLSTTPKTTVIAEMPIYNWNNPYGAQEFWRIYYSTQDFRKTVNGVSGFSPPPWQNFVVGEFRDFPSDKTIGELKKIGVNLIIVHKAEYDRINKDNFIFQNKRVPSGEEVIKYLSNNKEVELVKNFEEDYVYKIK